MPRAARLASSFALTPSARKDPSVISPLSVVRFEIYNSKPPKRNEVPILTRRPCAVSTSKNS
jgi:hypothetical protein